MTSPDSIETMCPHYVPMDLPCCACDRWPDAAQLEGWRQVCLDFGIKPDSGSLRVRLERLAPMSALADSVMVATLRAAAAVAREAACPSDGIAVRLEAMADATARTYVPGAQEGDRCARCLRMEAQP